MTTSSDIALALLENTVPVLRIVGGRKTPHKLGEPGLWGNWDAIGWPDKLDGWLKPDDNLAMLLVQHGVDGLWKESL